MFKTADETNVNFHKTILRGKDHKRPRKSDNERNIAILPERDGFNKKYPEGSVCPFEMFLGKKWLEKQLSSTNYPSLNIIFKGIMKEAKE
jgi:hypothetical protein